MHERRGGDRHRVSAFYVFGRAHNPEHVFERRLAFRASNLGALLNREANFADDALFTSGARAFTAARRHLILLKLNRPFNVVL